MQFPDSNLTAAEKTNINETTFVSTEETAPVVNSTTAPPAHNTIPDVTVAPVKDAVDNVPVAAMDHDLANKTARDESENPEAGLEAISTKTPDLDIPDKNDAVRDIQLNARTSERELQEISYQS